MMSEHNSSVLSGELVKGSHGELPKTVSREKDMCRLQQLHDHQLETNHTVNVNHSSEYRQTRFGISDNYVGLVKAQWLRRVVINGVTLAAAA